MTNWSRVFENQFQRIKWLKTYASINHVATFKILKKFMKNYFNIKENTLALRVKQNILSQPFLANKDLAMLTRDLILFYSKAFTRDNIPLARRVLNRHSSRISAHDAIQISFWLGMCLVLFVVLVYIIILCEAKRSDWIQEIGSSTPIYYCTGMITYIVFAAGFCIQVFKSHSINYTFIFEVDHNYKLNQY